VEGFSLTSGEKFDIVWTGDGLTSFSPDGVNCGAFGGAVFDTFS
jgi:hypothetical protein